MHRLAENVMHFGRVLRQAGVPVGTDRIQLALQALQVAGLESRADFRAALAACLLDRHEHRAMFDQAFDLYWRDPDLAGRMMQMLLPQVRANDAGAPPPPPENRRLGEAFSAGAPPRPLQPEPPDEVQVEATLTFSERELLQRADFDTMSPDEWLQAKRALRRMKPLFE
ncbi:MAG: hypothetical protein IIZ92_12280, partial [Aquincola sp.]|nr:hypothetical protein [Aquincola sp.]